MTIMETADGTHRVTQVNLDGRQELRLQRRGSPGVLDRWYLDGGDLGPESKDLGRFLSAESLVRHLGADRAATLRPVAPW